MENKKVADMTLREYYLGIAMQVVGQPRHVLENGRAVTDYKGYVAECNEIVDNIMKLSK
jgi:hypothetical protein